MCDENIRTTLRNYVQDKTKWFFWYHDINRLEKIRKFEEIQKKEPKEDTVLKEYQEENRRPMNLLCGFLDSTLDETRLKKANDFSRYALYISDKRSFSYFRRAESKREMSGEIDYDKHRDHAVHTLYNYLLGWYIFDHLPAFRDAFREFFKTSLNITLEANKKEKNFYRNFYHFPPHGLDDTCFFEAMSLVNHFGDVWPLASLLHDVGYILEGTLSPATPKIEHERVTNGTKVLHDYFNHWLWRHTEVDFRAAIDIARNINCVVPDFKESKSMPALSDRLRDIGNLENIMKKRTDNIGSLNPDDKDDRSLNLEAFKLWELFYERYINKKIMKLILDEVKKQYENDLWEGGIISKINLNHGVSGGLMLLQASTFWYEFMWGLESINWSYIHLIQEEQRSNEPVSEKVFDNIKNEITKVRIPAHIWLREEKGFLYMDWVKDLWATAAVAIHDYVTKEAWNRDDKKEKLKIDLQTDPLAYLEILVDVLQEWDRYTVLGESAFSENEPLQSYETQLNIENEVSSYISASLDVSNTEAHLDMIGISAITDSKLLLTYPKRDPKQDGKKFKAEVEKNLDRILTGWKEYVVIDEIDISGRNRALKLLSY
jgi:hypothetical protein